jgi:hypothetical protein
MKQLAVLLFTFLAFTQVIKADEYIIKREALPKGAIEFLETHYKDKKVSFAKMDKEIFQTTYGVTLVNGVQIEFNKKGEWMSVDAGKLEVVPKAIIPQQILAFITQNYAELQIREIEYESREYTVELGNGLDLEFNRKGEVKNHK